MLADRQHTSSRPKILVAMKEQGNHVYTCSMRHGHDTCLDCMHSKQYALQGFTRREGDTLLCVYSHC